MEEHLLHELFRTLIRKIDHMDANVKALTDVVAKIKTDVAAVLAKLTAGIDAEDMTAIKAAVADLEAADAALNPVPTPNVPPVGAAS